MLLANLQWKKCFWNNFQLLAWTHIMISVSNCVTCAWNLCWNTHFWDMISTACRIGMELVFYLTVTGRQISQDLSIHIGAGCPKLLFRTCFCIVTDSPEHIAPFCILCDSHKFKSIMVKKWLRLFHHVQNQDFSFPSLPCLWRWKNAVMGWVASFAWYE